MKKYIKILIFLLFITPFLNVCSCTFLNEKDGSFSVDGEIGDLLTVESKIPEPIPSQHKYEYCKNLEEIIKKSFNGAKEGIDYKIAFSNEDKEYFEVEEEIFIFSTDDSKLIYSSRPIRKVVNYLSLTYFNDQIENYKPKTGEQIKDSIKKLSRNVEEIITNIKYNTDFEIIFESKNDSVWTKNDTIYIKSIITSKILRGVAQFKIYLLDLNTLDYSDIFPRKNQTKEKVITVIEEKIKKNEKNAKYNVDYYIDFSSTGDILEDGDIVFLYADPNSKFISGNRQEFLIKTFNLSQVEDELKKLRYNFNVLISDIKYDIQELMLKFVPEAQINIDYSIEVDTQYSVLYPGTNIVISALSTSEFLSGDSIILTTPKLELNFVEKQITDINILIGKTTKEYFKKEVLKKMANIFSELDVTDELVFYYSNNESTFIGDEVIEISPNHNSKIFLNNGENVKILTNKIESTSLKDLFDSLIFTESETSIEFTAGTEKDEVSKIFKNILKTSESYSILSENEDYEIIYNNNNNNNNNFLRANEKITFNILESSKYLKGKSFDYFVKDFDIKDLIIILNDIEIKVGECKNHIIERVKSKLEEAATFINFEKDFELKFVSEYNLEDSDEVCDFLRSGEKIELIIKENSSLSIMEQKIELIF